MNAQRIAVIGLGQMGARYARRFVDAGLRVTVWNRSPQKAEPLAAIGASVAASPAEAVQAADIVIAALENAAAFRDTFLAPETLARLTERHLLIDTGTVHPDASREAQAALAQRGCRYLDAPVSGGTVGAAQGTLTLLVGGDADDFRRARPVLDILGKSHLLGPTGAGQVAKLVNQTIVAVTIGAVAEGLFLGERAGIRPAALLSALEGGFADSRILREHGKRMAERNFAPGAANRIFLKDLTAIERLAGELGTTLPLTRLTARAFADLVAAGHGESDHSGYFIHLGLVNDADNSAPLRCKPCS
jgi:2-hydroxy-3-oxopropionate reductase